MELDRLLSEAAPVRVLSPTTEAALEQLAEAGRRASRRRRLWLRGGIAAGILAAVLGGGTAAYASFVEPLDDKPDHGDWSSVSQWQTKIDGMQLACSLGFEVSADATTDADPRSLAEARRFVAALALDDVAESATYARELKSSELLSASAPPIRGQSAADARRFSATSAAMGAMGDSVFELLTQDLARKRLPVIPQSADEEIGGQCQVVSK